MSSSYPSRMSLSPLSIGKRLHGDSRAELADAVLLIDRGRKELFSTPPRSLMHSLDTLSAPKRANRPSLQRTQARSQELEEIAGQQKSLPKYNIFIPLVSSPCVRKTLVINLVTEMVCRQSALEIWPVEPMMAPGIPCMASSCGEKLKKPEAIRPRKLAIRILLHACQIIPRQS
jgi:hypothetical protein